MVIFVSDRQYSLCKHFITCARAYLSDDHLEEGSVPASLVDQSDDELFVGHRRSVGRAGHVEPETFGKPAHLGKEGKNDCRKVLLLMHACSPNLP